ncbi:hypothetical protein DEJ50_13440 [Streptomyces venezuelae]|uniref:Flp pilus assembly protein RcpC/CpaB domain-containing protein n=1 Tax=Streptomyces venezuelae TaxID=54571 RepID=A0A5P2D6B2_STRVZ|nr:hypothetical protein [Streptomyces venezuelae]QES48679.1 hypothetical protein DEJ50_13440 [Streptomyces venezuelae]
MSGFEIDQTGRAGWTGRVSAAACPPPRGVPAFAPLRVGRGAGRLRRAVRRRRRAAGAGLAVTAVAALAVGGAEARPARSEPPPPASASASGPRAAPVRLVSAPVRIADGATVRLLRPGDRVDVVASERDGPARVLAAGARVAGVPAADEGVGDGGALVVLSVPRDTARELVGAGTRARLAVTLC